jgi:hypothetical protein
MLDVASPVASPSPRVSNVPSTDIMRMPRYTAELPSSDIALLQYVSGRRDTTPIREPWRRVNLNVTPLRKPLKDRCPTESDLD